MIERVSRTFLLEQGNFPWQQNRAESPRVFHPDSLVCWSFVRSFEVHFKFHRVPQLQGNKNGWRQATRGLFGGIYMATHGCMRATRGAISLQLPHRNWSTRPLPIEPHRRISARAQTQLRIFVSEIRCVRFVRAHTRAHARVRVKDDAFTHRITCTDVSTCMHVCMHSRRVWVHAHARWCTHGYTRSRDIIPCG